MSREAAIEELEANSGTQFDPRIVEAISRVVEPQESTTADEVRALLAGSALSTPEYSG
jgi:HD-GYP domain-containing protein (c-di-GMP phosphodiesterase class II)